MEVYALVGPAGTGKSHRASFVARQYGVEYIIDDGLLIHGGRILAGTSAKREATAMAAVRRAVFRDPAHAAAVRAALREHKPERILILGTSRDMVDRICDALDLPRAEKTIDITEVATPEEIRRARRTRRVEGKHVIPAPTFEVKRRFSGYLVDPLRLFHGGKARRGRDEVVIEKSMVRPTFSSLGRFTIADSVVAAIAERAAREVPGVAGCQRVHVESAPDGVRLRIDLILHYGTRLLPAMAQVREHAREVVERLTALNVLDLEVVARQVVVRKEEG